MYIFAPLGIISGHSIPVRRQRESNTHVVIGSKSLGGDHSSSFCEGNSLGGYQPNGTVDIPLIEAAHPWLRVESTHNTFNVNVGPVPSFV